jgi:hypothetical protein
MRNSIGWLGTQLLAWCALPALIDVVSKRDGSGYDIWFLLMWGLGELLTAIYVYNKHKDWPLLINYTLNLAFISIIVCYKI